MAASAEATIDINAPADRVYDLVADLPRMGRLSPECIRCDWLDGATAAAPGARFKGRNRIGPRRWSTTGEVVVAAPGRELTFDITSVFGLPVARWRYVIEPSGAACRVTESMEDRRGRLLHTLGRLVSGIADRPTHNRSGMEATLASLKSLAEAG